MANISGNRVLIVGSAAGLSHALFQQFELGNLPTEFLPGDAIQWHSKSEAFTQLSQIKPTLLFNALPLDSDSSSSADWEALVNRTQWLGEYCLEHSVKLVQLSSADVFANNNKKAYDENEIPEPTTSLAKQLLACEQAVPEALSEKIILRLAWMLNTHGGNLFTTILSTLVNEKTLAVDQSKKGAPIWLDDALRVCGTVVRQILAGADNWGILHYASADPCSEKELAQQILDSLSDIQDVSDLKLEAIPAAEQVKSSAVLKCRRVRNNFGVHGRTWRQGLKSRIQFWLDSNINNQKLKQNLAKHLANEKSSAQKNHATAKSDV